MTTAKVSYVCKRCRRPIVFDELRILASGSTFRAFRHYPTPLVPAVHEIEPLAIATPSESELRMEWGDR